MLIDSKNLPSDVAKLHSIIGEQIVQIAAHQKDILNFELNFQVQIEQHNTQIQVKDDQIKSRDVEIDILQEALCLARRQRFAAHSEKLPSDQSELFDEAEVLKSKHFDSSTAQEEETCDDIVVPEHKRKRSKRKPLPDHLPREVVIIDLPEAEKVCKIHGSTFKEIGEEVSERLDIVPAKMKVIRTDRKSVV